MEIRAEVSAFVRACEHVLSLNMQSDLTDAERALIEYYVNELSHKHPASVGKGGSGLF